MGNKIFSKITSSGGSSSLPLNELRDLSLKTGFSFGQIEQLYTRFAELDSRKESRIGRKDFESISELKVNPLKDRIIDVMLQYSASDSDIDFTTFVTIISMFRTVSSDTDVEKRDRRRLEKLEFAFRVYDTDNDSRINHSDLCEILCKMIGSSTSNEKIEQIADRVISDVNGEDMEISFEDYCHYFASDDIHLKMSIPFLKRKL